MDAPHARTHTHVDTHTHTNSGAPPITSPRSKPSLSTLLGSVGGSRGWVVSSRRCVSLLHESRAVMREQVELDSQMGSKGHQVVGLVIFLSELPFGRGGKKGC